MIDLTPYTDSNGDIDLQKELIEVLVGAINGQVESGSDANGHFWKFESGLLVCLGTMTFMKDNKGGTLYYFPTPFIDTNYFVKASPTSYAYAPDQAWPVFHAETIPNSVSRFSSRLVTITPGSVQMPGYNFNGIYIAIGRWK